MNQQKWRQKAYDEWVGRTTGARMNMDQARGADARRAADAARARSQNVPKPPSFSPPVAPAPVRRNQAPAAIWPVAEWRDARTAGTSRSAAPSASRVLALVGGLVGYGYGVAAGLEVPWLLALGGVLAGAFALDVLAVVFRVVKVVVLAILTLAGLAVALYLLSMFIGN